MIARLDISTLQRLFLSFIVGACAPFQHACAQSASSLQSLIEELGDPDFNTREIAQRTLIRMDRLAREEIRAALNASDPEIRLRARNILGQMSWAIPGDSAAVRTLLYRYGNKPIEMRRQVIDNLAQLSNAAGLPALCRLIQEDPDTSVRWHIFGRFRNSCDEDKYLADSLQFATGNAAALSLAAWCMEEKSQSKALSLYSQAIQLDAVEREDDAREFDFVFEHLYSYYRSNQDTPSAIQIVRADAARRSFRRREGWNDPLRHDELFALHAEVGPLPGFQHDLWQYRWDLARPEILYALGRVAAHHNLPTVESFLNSCALCFASQPQYQRHYQVANFLMSHHWYDLAQHELRAMTANDSDPNNWEAVNAHLRLAYIAQVIGDDRMAADEYQGAINCGRRQGGTLVIQRDNRLIDGEEAERDLNATIASLRQRAAQKLPATQPR